MRLLAAPARLALLALFAVAGPARGAGDPGDAGLGASPPAAEPPAVEIPAGEPEVRAFASASEVALGEVFYLFVEVVHPPGMHINLPATLPLGPAFEETARASHSSRRGDGTLVRQFEIAVMAFDLGDLEIPPTPVTYTAAGAVREVVTEGVPIHVASTIGDGEATLRDIAPPVPLLRTSLTLLWVLAGVAAALAAALVVLGLRRALRRRARRQRAVAAAERVDPVTDALAKLEALEAAGALDADDLKPAYHEMSEILREYLGRRFGFPALDLTTLEIRIQLAATPGGEAAVREIGAWLERCDLVKFASYAVTAEEARDALYEARLFVERSRPGPDAAEPPGGEHA